jgi:hypothetical protein
MWDENSYWHPRVTSIISTTRICHEALFGEKVKVRGFLDPKTEIIRMVNIEAE